MTTNDYQTSMIASAPAEDVASKIRRVFDWWTLNFEGETHRTGDKFQVTFGETFVKFVVAEDIGQRIIWRVTDCNLHWLQNRKEWLGTEIVWVLISDGMNTTVTMKHVGLRPDAECYQMCERGWNFYVGESLCRLINENVGLPDLEHANRSLSR